MSDAERLDALQQNRGRSLALASGCRLLVRSFQRLLQLLLSGRRERQFGL